MVKKKLLLESQVLKVIKNIKKMAGVNEESEKLIAYYEGNKERMDYKSCQQMGCGIIGSGAIESAHRTVVIINIDKYYRDIFSFAIFRTIMIQC